MVDETRGLFYRIGVVGGRRELVCVPCQVNVESRDCCVVWVRGDDVDVAGILLDETSHGGASCGGMDPVNGLHLFDK